MGWGNWGNGWVNGNGSWGQRKQRNKGKGGGKGGGGPDGGDGGGDGNITVDIEGIELVEIREASSATVAGLFSYTGQRDDELSFEKDEVMDVIREREDEPEWLICRKAGGEEGLVPRNYVEKVAPASSGTGDGIAITTDTSSTDAEDLIPKHVAMNPALATLGDFIGRGSFGSVYEGTYNFGSTRRPDTRRVAFKRLTTAAFVPAVMESFKAEIEIMCRLNHPNILKLFGACSDIEAVDARGKGRMSFEPSASGCRDVNKRLASLTWLGKKTVQTCNRVVAIEKIERQRAP